jgi:hypothetical protein
VRPFWLLVAQVCALDVAAYCDSSLSFQQNRIVVSSWMGLPS